ncbi:hemolysin family protein [Kistimonas asteriae]|uniref:hemolysin family protein n=1 Tax=Kistimonas asteriae TaxID=517724 RepID=UPI001BAC305E|nr:hemolysin family protein [Kistimonas asteriae]
MDVLILIALILLNGVFAMSEIALVSARKSRLQRLADKGDAGAASAIRLGEEPTRFLSTVQIGITVIGLLNGIYGEAALAAPLAEYMASFDISTKTASAASTVIVVIAITYLSIVVGELVPKRLAQFNPELFARMMARPLSLLALLSKPFVSLLAWSTDLVLRLLGRRGGEFEENIIEEDIIALMAEGSRSGAIDAQERDMVRNVFHLDDRKVSSLMTPRSEMKAFDLGKPLDENIQCLLACGHERFPVIDGDMENPLGVLSARQLLTIKLTGVVDNEAILAAVQPPVFIPESWRGTRLLEFYRQCNNHLVFVVDEYGDLQGMVTHGDLLEALTGEFKSHLPEDNWSEQHLDGSWTMDGLIPVFVLRDLLELDTLPDEHKRGYHTLSGMMMWCLTDMPKVGESVEWEGWQFILLSVEGNRPEKVLVRRSRGGVNVRVN